MNNRLTSGRPCRDGGRKPRPRPALSGRRPSHVDGHEVVDVDEPAEVVGVPEIVQLEDGFSCTRSIS